MRAFITGLRALVIGAALAGGVACVIHPAPAPVAADVGVATDYYTPLYYYGYLVYYDDYGRPFYYLNGVAYWVPPTFIYYDRLIAHYRVHRRAYHRWYRNSGRLHQGYRHPTYRGPYHRGGAPSRGPTHRSGTSRGGAGHRWR